MRVGVILAAGASSRMKRPKALVKDHGVSFLAQGVRHLWSACETVVVVLGANAASIQRAVEGEFERLVNEGRLMSDLTLAHHHGSDGLEARFIANTGWRSGMYGSVRLGLREAVGLKPESVILLPVDHPGVKPETVEILASAMHDALRAYRRAAPRGGFGYALVPRYGRRRGHPIALSPALAKAIAADAEAEDLSDAVRRNARLVGYLDVGDPGVLRNRNTPSD